VLDLVADIGIRSNLSSSSLESLGSLFESIGLTESERRSAAKFLSPAIAKALQSDDWKTRAAAAWLAGVIQDEGSVWGKGDALSCGLARSHGLVGEKPTQVTASHGPGIEPCRCSGNTVFDA